ncbi:MAG: hypothetical protein QOJ73_3840 [Streptosporangiaceae bacterium]|jgi:hypothetical protein|nr:hypothetical protein [Streptosporangiaceae bacterium]
MVTGRASALLQLAGELPPTVVADLLGLRPKTAIAWGQLAGRPWAAAYPGLRASSYRQDTAWCRRGARVMRPAAIGDEKCGPASRKPEQLDAHPA